MAIDVSNESKPIYEHYEELNLREPVLRGVYDYGFEKPSKIQQQAVIPICSGSDVVIEQDLSSDSVAAYLIGILNRINTENHHVQALILCPTREHVYNVSQVFLMLAKYTNVNTTRCIGGVSLKGDIETLKTTIHVIFGTPGRVNDLSNRGVLDLSYLKIFCIGSLARVLGNGYDALIDDIHAKHPHHTQVILRFDKTSPVVETAIEKYTRNAIRCGYLASRGLNLNGIKQFYVKVDDRQEKLNVMLEILESSVSSSAQVIIYVSDYRQRKQIAQQLKQDYPISYIDNNIKVKEEEKLEQLEKFQRGSTRFLLSDDYTMTHRKDASIVHLVINYHLPYSPERYITRVGRIGRYGKVGTVINFKVGNDNTVDKIRQYYQTEIALLEPNKLSDLW